MQAAESNLSVYLFMRSRMSKYFPMDAKKLVSLACALFASRCHTEDRFWKNRIEALLPKLLRNGHQSVLDAALEQLQKNHPGACSVLAELAEAQSESFTFEHECSAYPGLDPLFHPIRRVKAGLDPDLAVSSSGICIGAEYAGCGCALFVQY